MSGVHKAVEAAGAIQKCRGLPSLLSEHLCVEKVHPWP
jgi:hypothetical protein